MRTHQQFDDQDHHERIKQDGLIGIGEKDDKTDQRNRDAPDNQSRKRKIQGM